MTHNEKNIAYIDGLLSGVALLCHDCDFVPFYGAELISLKGVLSEQQVFKYFQDKGTELKFNELDPVLRDSSNLDPLMFYVNKLTKKWVEDKIFEGGLKNLSNGSQHIKTFSNNLIELIEDDLGKTKVWHVTLENGYEHDAEGILIEGNTNCLIYFGFSD